MLADRIIGAFTLRRGVYADVEKDKSFTTTAWFLVLVVAFLNQLGSFASRDIFSWLITSIVSTVFAILGFVVGAVVINFVGRLVFKADIRFDEMVRTLGLAYVWQVVGVLGILTTFSKGTESRGKGYPSCRSLAVVKGRAAMSRRERTSSGRTPAWSSFLL